MATVKYTDKLDREIRSFIDQLRMKDQGPERNTSAMTVAEIKAVEALLWKEAPDLQPLMPASWKKKYSNFTLQVDAEGGPAMRLDVEAPLGLSFEFPPRYDRYSGNIIATEEELEKNMPCIWALHLSAKRSIECINKWAAIYKQVVGFIQEFPSVNAAAKAWPELRLYLPPDTLKKMDAQVKRSTKVADAAEKVAKLDTDALVAAAVSARLS